MSKTYVYSDSSNTVETLELISDKINELEHQKVYSSMFRSRSNWTKHREKMSKYYFALEKRNYVNKTMFAVFTDDGTLCTNQMQILKEQEKCYKDLYTTNQSVHFDVVNQTGTMLSNEQKKWLDEEIKKEEIYTAAKQMKKGKVAGCDGLPIEWYLHFWDDISDILWEMYQEVMDLGILGLTARRGVISLLPKKSKDARYIKNLRSLTQLNTDYKILVKTMALRMKKVLPDIIDTTQCGFMEGRQIQNCLRRTIDVIAHINHTRTKAVVVSIDFLLQFWTKIHIMGQYIF